MSYENSLESYDNDNDGSSSDDSIPCILQSTSIWYASLS